MLTRALILLSFLGGSLNAQELSRENYRQVRRFLEPSEAELAWMSLGWRTTLWSAVIEAQAKERPILLWAMNGHPLACT